MNRLATLKSLAAAAVVIGGFAAGAAHARTDVFLQIGVPGVYVQPAPVYVQPRPVYVQPHPVYVQPAPVWDSRRGAYGDRDGDGIANVYDRYDNRYGHRHGHHGRHVRADGAWGDADRDGIANRHDRAPYNPHRR